MLNFSHSLVVCPSLFLLVSSVAHCQGKVAVGVCELVPWLVILTRLLYIRIQSASIVMQQISYYMALVCICQILAQ